MKRKLYTCIFALSAILTVKAQNKDFDKESITDFCDQTEVEDSDGLTKSDYYSNVLFVRSGSEKYTVQTGECWHSDLLYAEIENILNKHLWKTAYIRGTEKTVPQDRVPIYYPEESQMKPIVEQVFPRCVISSSRDTKNQQSMFIYMAVDPDTEEVFEVSFSIDSFNPETIAQSTLFSLPPSKLRQLEELIKGNVEVKIREGHKYLSYSKAVYHIYFKHFEL